MGKSRLLVFRGIAILLIFLAFSLTDCSKNDKYSKERQAPGIDSTLSGFAYPIESISFAIAGDTALYGWSRRVSDFRMGHLKSMLYSVLGWEKPSPKTFSKHEQQLRAAAEGKKLHIATFPNNFSKDYFFNKPGDNVTLLSANGVKVGNIGANGVAINGSVHLFIEIINPRNFRLLDDDKGKIFVVINDDYKFHGAIIPFKEYALNDAAFNEKLDIIKEIAIVNIRDTYPYNLLPPGDFYPEGQHIEYNKYFHSIRDDIVIKAYGAKCDSIPDTLLVTISKYDKDFLCGCTTLYFLIKDGKSWAYKEAMPARMGLPEFNINFAFDLNYDDTLEYLVSWQSACMIYTWKNGEFSSADNKLFFDASNIIIN